MSHFALISPCSSILSFASLLQLLLRLFSRANLSREYSVCCYEGKDYSSTRHSSYGILALISSLELMFVWCDYGHRGILPAIDLLGNHALVGVSCILLLLYVYFSDELFKQLQSFLFFLHFSRYILITVPISRIFFCHLIFELMIIPIFHCCRYFTLLDLDCSASSRCSASGLFRFNIQLQLSRSCCVVLVSYVFWLSCAASLHVFPGQWQGCRDETRGCKINHDGSSVMPRLCNENATSER